MIDRDRRRPGPARSWPRPWTIRACVGPGAAAIRSRSTWRRPELRADAEAVLDLIYHEVLLRRRAGEEPGGSEYLGRFPALSGPIGQLFEVDGAFVDDEPTIRPASGGPSPRDAAGPAAPPASPDVPGFEIENFLGRGGMGVVYKARERAFNRTVALKMVLAGDLATPEQLARFRAEAEAAARLQHANIVQIYSVGEHGGRPVLVLEYVAGEGLDDHLGGVPQSDRSAARLVETLAQRRPACPRPWDRPPRPQALEHPAVGRRDAEDRRLRPGHVPRWRRRADR